MIKTQILLRKTIAGKRRLRVRVRVMFILFYFELAPLTRDVTCSRLYLGGKSMRRKCQINKLVYIFRAMVNIFFYLTLSLYEKCPYSEFFWSVFPRINISPYSVRMRENTHHKNSEYIWTLFTQCVMPSVLEIVKNMLQISKEILCKNIRMRKR